MSRVSVDAGAYRMVLNILNRAAERHGEPTLAEAAKELKKTAYVIDGGDLDFEVAPTNV